MEERAVAERWSRDWSLPDRTPLLLSRARVEETPLEEPLERVTLPLERAELLAPLERVVEVLLPLERVALPLRRLLSCCTLFTPEERVDEEEPLILPEERVLEEPLERVLEDPLERVEELLLEERLPERELEELPEERELPLC